MNFSRQSANFARQLDRWDFKSEILQIQFEKLPSNLF